MFGSVRSRPVKLSGKQQALISLKSAKKRDENASWKRL